MCIEAINKFMLYPQNLKSSLIFQPGMNTSSCGRASFNNLNVMLKITEDMPHQNDQN